MPDELDVGLSEKDVQTIVTEIEEGKIVLPEFQRDFVWPTDQVGKLLESILNGYYINTLLTLPVVAGQDNVPFPPRAVESSSDRPAESGSMEMVLDGQQRITSIYYALNAPEMPLANTKYPQLFGLNFQNVVDGVLDEDAIEWNSTYYGIWGDLAVDDYETQIEKNFIPFTVFKNSEIFDEWRFGMEDYARESDALTIEDIREFDRNTKVFRNYDLQIIKMNADTAASTVVQTFERINTQGLELGVFDILTARLYPHNIKLRKLWNAAKDDYSQLNTHLESTSEEVLRRRILKTLALHRGVECKDSRIRELEPTDFEDDWERTCRMVNRALEKAQSSDVGGLGVTQKFGFPYGTMLPPLANFINIAEIEPTYPDSDALSKTQQWYWASVFSRRYSGSSDTIATKDNQEVTAWIRGEREAPPEAIAAAPETIAIDLELESLTRGGAYKGVMGLLVLNRAKDFGTGESINIHEVDDHHIFPNAALRSGLESFGADYEATERDRILNRTIIESRGNRFRYRDDRPSEYVPQMIEEHDRGEEGVKDLLQDHFINEEGFNAMLDDDYERFCEARKAEIRDEIETRISMEIDWSIGERTLEST